MEWYVLNYDFNKGEAYNYNIFTSTRFLEGLKTIHKEMGSLFATDFEEFKIKLNVLLTYCFWSKCEYEIYVTDAFHHEDNEISKVDVYSQLRPNLDILASYIINHEYEI